MNKKDLFFLFNEAPEDETPESNVPETDSDEESEEQESPGEETSEDEETQDDEPEDEDPEIDSDEEEGSDDTDTDAYGDDTEDNEEDHGLEPHELYIKREHFRAFRNLVSNIRKLNSNMEEFKYKYPTVEVMAEINRIQGSTKQLTDTINELTFTELINKLDNSELTRVHNTAKKIFKSNVDEYIRFAKKILKQVDKGVFDDI